MKVMIIGGGKVGTYLANYLLSENHEVRLIESRPEEKSRILLDVPESALYFGSGTDPDTLEAAGIRKMNVVAAVTGIDEVTWSRPAWHASNLWSRAPLRASITPKTLGCSPK